MVVRLWSASRFGTTRFWAISVMVAAFAGLWVWEVLGAMGEKRSGKRGEGITRSEESLKGMLGFDSVFYETRLVTRPSHLHVPKLPPSFRLGLWEYLSPCFSCSSTLFAFDGSALYF